jgi:hypothetical protein
MKKPFALCLCLGSFLVVSICPAADLKQSKFTQVVNDVRVISAANNEEKPAAVNDIFNMPDYVRTGEASRAELVAADDTITRVGANTIFSFDPASRTIDLQQGSLLFHSPKGKGGGTIRTSSATASVLGTTLIVSTTRSGGFKVIDLEGHVAIKFLTGLRQDLYPGQMTFVLAGGRPAPVITIRLDTLTKGSQLVQGFAEPLPSLPLIQQQVATQVKQIESGQAQDTGLLVGDDATSDSVQVVKVDPNTISGVQQSSGDLKSSGETVAINSPNLDPAFISTFSFSNGVGGTSSFSAFIAPNITINTPTINLSPYGSEFSFIADGAFDFNSTSSSSSPFNNEGTLTINGSVTFTGLPVSSASFLELIAGNQLTISSGSTVEADVGTFILEALGSGGMTLNGVNIVDNAPSGDIVIGALSSISLTGSSFHTPRNGTVSFFSENGSVTIDVSGQAGINTGTLDITAAGSITFTDSNSNSQSSTQGVNSNSGTITAGDSIFVNAGNSTPAVGNTGPLGQGTLSFTAANLIQMQNVSFGNSYINITANTINLSNVDFQSGSQVSLACLNGMLAGSPNTNQPNVVMGDVNFIKNVTYGGSPAQNFVPIAQGGALSSGTAPITISVR